MAVRQATLADVLTFHVAGGVAVGDTLTRGAREKMASPALTHTCRDKDENWDGGQRRAKHGGRRGTAVDGREVRSAARLEHTMRRWSRFPACRARDRSRAPDRSSAAEPAVPGETNAAEHGARAASSSICSVTNHCSITVAGRSLVFSAIAHVVDGLSNLLLVLEDVITQRLGRGPPRRRCAHGGQKHFLIALDEVIDDALRVHQFVGRLLPHPLREPWKVVLGQPDGHGEILVRRTEFELQVLVEAVQQVTVHGLQIAACGACSAGGASGAEGAGAEGAWCLGCLRCWHPPVLRLRAMGTV